MKKRAYTTKRNKEDPANLLQPGQPAGTRGTGTTRGKKKRGPNALDSRTVVAINPFDDEPPQLASNHYSHHQHHPMHNQHLQYPPGAQPPGGPMMQQGGMQMHPQHAQNSHFHHQQHPHHGPIPPPHHQHHQQHLQQHQQPYPPLMSPGLPGPPMGPYGGMTMHAQGPGAYQPLASPSPNQQHFQPHPQALTPTQQQQHQQQMHHQQPHHQPQSVHHYGGAMPPGQGPPPLTSPSPNQQLYHSHPQAIPPAQQQPQMHHQQHHPQPGHHYGGAMPPAQGPPPNQQSSPFDGMQPPHQQQSPAIIAQHQPAPSSPAYCCECGQPIYGHESIMCRAGCESYYHQACSGLTELACEMLKAEPSAEWACNRCICSDPKIPVVRTISQQHHTSNNNGNNNNNIGQSSVANHQSAPQPLPPHLVDDARQAPVQWA